MHADEVVGHESQSQGVSVPWHTLPLGQGAELSAYWHHVPSAAHGQESACVRMSRSVSSEGDAEAPRAAAESATTTAAAEESAGRRRREGIGSSSRGEMEEGGDVQSIDTHHVYTHVQSCKATHAGVIP